MEFDENNLVLDFVKRTKKNLEFVEEYVNNHQLEPDIEVYEVTQLINSLLGLLVFPEQKFFDEIPKTPLSELIEIGWPEIHIIKGNLRQDNLQELMRYLRNGISHFHVKFLNNDMGIISGICIWNTPQNSSPPDWKANFSLDDLKRIVFKFIELIEDRIKNV